MDGTIDLVRTPNSLLAGMAAEDRALLCPCLRRETLEARSYLERCGAPIDKVYFIEGGVVSLLEARDPGDPVEVGVVGWEGMTGSSAILGNLHPDRDSYVQVAGCALAMELGELHGAIMSSPTLGRYLLRYIQTQIGQLSLAVSAAMKASLQQRLARKLLMYHDRLGMDELPLTHENISIMLGVRRASVTIAIHNLEAEGWIKAQRGLVTIRDRAGLQHYCAQFYGVAEARYAQIIGRPIGCIVS
jgi:CRP-like cAMP-binding protein